MIGTVKWFNDEKGFGFISQSGGGRDIFVHYSSIRMEGHRTLTEGQSVSFDVEQTPRGEKATNVVVVS